MTSRSTAFSFLVALVAAVAILWATGSFGIGISPDSVSYIAAAHSFTAGYGFLAFDGKPYVAHPPLYPFLMGIAKALLGMDPAATARILSALLVGSTLFGTGHLLFAQCRAPWLAATALVGAAVALPLLHVSLMAWSEPLFIFLMVMWFIAAVRYRQHGRDGNSLPALLGMTASAALACATRNIGVSLIVAGTLLILMGARRRDARWLRDLALYATSLVPLGLWGVRNLLVSETVVGSWAASAYPLSANLQLTAATVSSWLSPIASTTVTWPALVALLLLVLALGAVVQRRQRPVLTLLLPALLVSILYLVMLIALSTRFAYDQIDSRLLAPVYLPLLFVGVSVLDALVGDNRRWQVVGAMVLLIVLLLPLPQSMALLQRSHREGQGYSNARWRQSETMAFVQGPTMPDCPIYTNSPYAVVGLTGVSAKWSPARTRYHSTEIVNDLATLNQSWPPEPEVCLVWFNDIGFGHLFSASDLQSVLAMEPVAQFADGAIYRVRR